MKTKLYTHDGVDRYLTFEVESEEDLENVERFLRGSNAYLGASDAGVVIKTKSGATLVEPGYVVVNLGATAQTPVVIGDIQYLNAFEVFRLDRFNELFKVVTFVR